MYCIFQNFSSHFQDSGLVKKLGTGGCQFHARKTNVNVK